MNVSKFSKLKGKEEGKKPGDKWSVLAEEDDFVECRWLFEEEESS